MLSRFERDGIELVIDEQTGEAFATQAGYARMSGKDRTTIVKRCQRLSELSQLKSAEIDTGYGIKVCELIPAKLVFKWALKDNLGLAEKMGECGATVFLHQLAGFQVKSVEIEKPKSAIELLEYHLVIAKEHEQRLLALEAENWRLKQLQERTEVRLDAVESEQDRYATPCGHKYSVLGYAKLQGLEISAGQASVKGRKASALCRLRGIEVERIHDPRFGKVGLYPESVLVEVFA